MPYRVQVVSTGYNGSPGYMTFYTNTINPADVAPWIAGLDLMLTGLQSVTANAVTATRSGVIEAFDASNGQTTGVVTGAPSSFVGSWGTAQSPQGTALLFQWRSGLYINGREVRGRTFWSGCGDFGDGFGAIPTSIITDAQNAIDDYVDTGFAAIYSPTNATMRQLATGTVWNKFALIRSRRD